MNMDKADLKDVDNKQNLKRIAWYFELVKSIWKKINKQ